jgi:hypothetical protein
MGRQDEQRVPAEILTKIQDLKGIPAEVGFSGDILGLAKEWASVM